MQSLPTIVALIAAILLTPRILRHLSEEGFVRENWRGAKLPFPGGIAIVAAAILALGACMAVTQLTDEWEIMRSAGLGATYLLGVALLGLIDDLLAGASRGWRGHGRAVLRGEFSTGVLKAAGMFALALWTVPFAGGFDDGRYVLEVALVVLTTNLFNLLDLRPGRAAKALVLLGIPLAVFAWNADDLWNVAPLWALGPFIAPVLVVGLYDLRERTMLGDTGANLIGGLAGLWMVFALDTTGQLIALAAVLALTVYGEFRSLSALIERTPLLRQIDSIGRNVPHA